MTAPAGSDTSGVAQAELAVLHALRSCWVLHTNPGAAKGLGGWRSDEAAQVCAKAKYQVILGGMIQQH